MKSFSPVALFIVLGFLAAGAVVGCGPSAKKCVNINDCQIGQSCLQGECRGTSVLGGGSATGGGAFATGGSSGTGGGSTGGGSTTGGGSSTGGGAATGGGGLIEPDAGRPNYDGGCGPPVPGNPTIHHLCAAPTTSECDGPTDNALAGGGVPTARLNGTSGNGFDDDCDGLVDEGCACPGNGMTKPCYLVPATQVDPTSGLPVGWCATNAKGSVDCTGGELASWSGVCRGAQPPALVDSCTPGDFNCDGLSGNNANQGCNCPNSVQCPTNVITMAPYPNPLSIPLIDGSAWIGDATQRAATTSWKWTILGGDCDNVLPFPTFALYGQATAIGRRGSRTAVKYDTTTSRYVPTPGSPLIAIYAPGFGNGVAGGQIHPAFGLSGDYIVQGEFTLDGKQYSCTQKVQVRAPGVRAELCWDSVGANDIDLHFARLQGATCATHGWNMTCTDDCYYLDASGCVSNSPHGPNWGYANSAESACLGWSSKRDSSGSQRCTNPRLDRDNISCDRNNADPTGMTFCGPENINLDNPHDGDTFAIGVNHYDSAAGSPIAHTHVNLYCNGERVISVGYNPATGATFPMLDTPGKDSSGDFWTVGTIKAHVNGSGQLTGCDVQTAPSRHADPARDGPAGASGGSPNCVDHTYTSHDFIDLPAQGGTIGGVPTASSQWCKH